MQQTLLVPSRSQQIFVNDEWLFLHHIRIVDISVQLPLNTIG